MRRMSRLIVSLSILGLAVAAHASTIAAGTYNLNNAFVLGDAVTGNVTFSAAGLATGVSLSFYDPAYSSTAVLFQTVTSANTFSGVGQDYFAVTNTTTDGTGQITLYFVNSPDSNGHFNLCVGGPCGTDGNQNSTLALNGYSVSGPPYYVGGTNGPVNFTSGYLALQGPAAAAPEPSSLILLGTGLLGFVGVARRRLL